MITQLSNAMPPLHHRHPGVFGLLRNPTTYVRSYFGIIANDVHLHPATVTVAFRPHPGGFILVIDAMHVMELYDGSC